MTIEYLPNIPWNAHAAIHRALEQIKEQDAVIIIWWDDDIKRVRYQSNGKQYNLAGLCQAASADLIQI